MHGCILFFDFFAALMCTPSSNPHPLADFRYCPRCGSDTFAPHDEKSNRCPVCGFTYYYNPAAATAALILNDCNELLVCRRANDPARGTLDLPGGFCDVGETAEDGVAREVAEETGLRVSFTPIFSSRCRTVTSFRILWWLRSTCFFVAAWLRTRLSRKRTMMRRNYCGYRSMHFAPKPSDWPPSSGAFAAFWTAPRSPLHKPCVRYETLSPG